MRFVTLIHFHYIMIQYIITNYIIRNISTWYRQIIGMIMKTMLCMLMMMTVKIQDTYSHYHNYDTHSTSGLIDVLEDKIVISSRYPNHIINILDKDKLKLTRTIKIDYYINFCIFVNKHVILLTHYSAIVLYNINNESIIQTKSVSNILGVGANHNHIFVLIREISNPL